MKVLIAGRDGYLGWTLVMYLTNKGHRVVGVDNFSRRKNVKLALGLLFPYEPWTKA